MNLRFFNNFIFFEMFYKIFNDNIILKTYILLYA